MKVCQSVRLLKSVLAGWQRKEVRTATTKAFLGFVPTMGHLHEGHRVLLEIAKKECRHVICSIFVNPQQFNQPRDYEGYPRTPTRDKRLVSQTGCDVLFFPKEQDIYPSSPVLKLDFGAITQPMEGAGRPGHFNGVGLVLSRLFHLISPTLVYLGEKDWQQCLVVQRLVSDLGFETKVRLVPTVRGAGGLAYSSRNSLLSQDNQGQALAIYETLCFGRDALKQGLPPQEVQQLGWIRLGNAKGLEAEYFCLVDSYSLEPITQLSDHESVSLCAAACVAGIRLIDNLRFSPL